MSEHEKISESGQEKTDTVPAVDYAGLLEAAQNDSERSSAAAIPTYKSVEQFTVKDLDRVYPAWKSEVGGDPELAAIKYARTNNLRALGREQGLGNHYLDHGGEGLEWAIDHTPREVGQQYDAHGMIARYDEAAGYGDVVGQFDALLPRGIDANRSFYTMPFIHEPGAASISADMPFTAGGLILVGGRGEKLVEGGIKYVVTGEEYSNVLDTLRKRYPQVTFVPWEEAPTFFTDQTNEAGATDIPLETLAPSEPPAYKPTVDLMREPAAALSPAELAQHAQEVKEKEETQRRAYEEADPEDAVW